MLPGKPADVPSTRPALTAGQAAQNVLLWRRPIRAAPCLPSVPRAAPLQATQLWVLRVWEASAAGLEGCSQALALCCADAQCSLPLRTGQPPPGGGGSRPRAHRQLLADWCLEGADWGPGGTDGHWGSQGQLLGGLCPPQQCWSAHPGAAAPVGLGPNACVVGGPGPRALAAWGAWSSSLCPRHLRCPSCGQKRRGPGAARLDGALGWLLPSGGQRAEGRGLPVWRDGPAVPQPRAEG